VLETERCVLRDWRSDETDRVLDLYGRWEVARWLGSKPSVMETTAQAERLVSRWAELNAEDPRFGRWAVARRSDDVAVGTVILVPIPDAGGEVEVGWHLHPDAWGNGYATEAARAALAHGFGVGLEEILAVVRPDNMPSLAVCRRLGMRELGRTRRYYDAELELFRLRAPTQS
jgi:RimJ/RimL family protein N-acetyltransferase